MQLLPLAADSAPRVPRNAAPRLLQVFIRPPAKFRQSFASPVLKKSRFFLLRRNFLPLYVGASRLPPRVLAVWAKTLREEIINTKIISQA